MVKDVFWATENVDKYPKNVSPSTITLSQTPKVSVSTTAKVKSQTLIFDVSYVLYTPYKYIYVS